MHQTTVRFSADLWAQLEQEARETGVSAAQYVREATLARLSYGAGQRDAAGAAPERSAATAVDDAAAQALEARSSASAVWAQAQLARERARLVRGRSRELQAGSRTV